MSASGLSAPDRLAGLTVDDFAGLIARFGPFEARPRLAVAVSGGPDSLALSLLAGRWAAERGGSLIGITVDHGLRPGSTEEARQVGAWLARRGIGHVVLTWTGGKPLSGVQAAARAARYRLLGDLCRARRIPHLLLAHHRDDQAETVVLRRASGSGASGLAGMPAVSEQAGIRLLRPLLGVAKAELVATLEAAGQPWLDDPSNRSPAFARGRLRLAGPPADPGPVGSFGARRAALDRRLAGWLARHARCDPLGFVDLEADVLGAAPDLAVEVLRRILQTVGGGRYPPASASLEEVRRRLDHGRCATLAGVLVRPGPTRVRFIREARATSWPLEPLGAEVWFDRRFGVACRPPRPDLAVAALGERGWLERRRLPLVREPDRPVERAVAESLPALVRHGVVVAVPQLGLAGPAAPPLDQVTVRFRPRHALAGAPFGAWPG